MARAYIDQEILFPSAARTTTVNGDDVAFEPDSAVFVLDVTAASGTTPLLDVTIEEKDFLSGQYHVIDTFPQKTGVTSERRVVSAPIGSILRARAVIAGGTPSFTFSVSAEGKNY